MVFLLFYLLSMPLVAATPAAARVSCAHTPTAFNCVQLVSIYDGDTIKVDIPKVHPYFGYHAGVRLAGIDTPEMISPEVCEMQMAIAARDYLVTLFAGAKRIDLIDIAKEKYGRVLATVMVDGKNVNQLMLAKGYARPYFGDKKQPWSCPP